MSRDSYRTGLSLFTTLFVSGTFAIGIDELRLRLMQRLSAPQQIPQRWRWTVATGASLAIAVAVVVPFWPDHVPPMTATTPKNVPPFFTSGSVHHIPTNSVVLAYPYPDQQTTNFIAFHPGQSILLDQAIAGMRFKIIGGYGWFPSPSGYNGTINPSILQPRSVQTVFDAAFSGISLTRSGPTSENDLAAQMRVFLEKFDVQTVIVLHQGKNPALAIADVTAAIGAPIESGGVTVWFHVRQRLASARDNGPRAPSQERTPSST